MVKSTTSLPTDVAYPTQHGMLIMWGRFGNAIGLMSQLRGVPIAQKTVIRAPQENLIEFFIGLLSGME